MKFKTTIVVGVSFFLVLCAALIVDAVLEHPQQAKALLSRVVPLVSDVADPAGAAPAATADETSPTISSALSQAVYPELLAKNNDLQTVRLGAVYDTIERTKDSDKYKFMVQLTSKGAAIEHVILSEFKERSDTASAAEILGDGSASPTGPQPLTLLSPWTNDGRAIYSLANTQLWLAPAEAAAFGPAAFPLHKLNWRLIEQSETQARFEAALADETGDYGVTVIKTWRLEPGSYDLACELELVNQSATPVKVMMKLQGPGGMGIEAVREDSRKVKVAYFDGAAGIETVELALSAMPKKIKKQDVEPFLLASKKDNTRQAWTALTNKYFAAIVRPLPDDRQSPAWLQFGTALYNPSTSGQEDDHQCSYTLASEALTLGAAGSADAAATYAMAVYLGPKDKRVFEDNPAYKALQFFQTIDFRGCCCPTAVIAPMAFFIMWIMNTLYMMMGPLGNYGVVIIVLVFLVRLAMHPITKKSQVSMMKMQKLGPKMKEIQAKYANNKQEMNKQVMAMYREQGSRPCRDAADAAADADLDRAVDGGLYERRYAGGGLFAVLDYRPVDAGPFV
jgi:YidC/Oxa1 family membrane protein insertase